MNEKPVVVTMGDPSGISGEILIKTWIERNQSSINKFFALDCTERLEKVANELKLEVPIKTINNPQEAIELFSECLPVLNLKSKVFAELGKPIKENGEYVLESIHKAIDFVNEGQAKALVTNPISKSIMKDYGFDFLGQTELISDILSKKIKKKFEEIMILTTTKPEDMGSNLKIGLVTTHIPICDISKSLYIEKIFSKVESFIISLRNFWKISNPKIGICGLNPHIGEDGKIGKEEEEIINPAIRSLSQKYNVVGPLSADTCFSKHKRTPFDGFICMYHDQGLIPIKTLDFYNSVNVTGGIPIIRTSPDHGPAFDISKLGVANNSSLKSSILLAGELSN